MRGKYSLIHISYVTFIQTILEFRTSHFHFSNI